MKFSIKLSFVFVLASFMVFGCDDYLDVNTDPNNPTSAPIEGLMINTTLESARNTQRVANTTSFFVQHFASSNTGSPTDIHESVSYGTTWERLYHNMMDLVVLTEQADELGAPHYSGPAKVMHAYNLALLVNMFGDVPYSEAFNAENLQPAYDSSEEIYGHVLTLLSEAITELQADETAASPGNDDLIFNGDLATWLQTAYSLQARYLNHYSDLGSYDPVAILNSVDNGFTGSDDDFQLEFFDEGNTATENPWYRAAVNNANLLLQAWLSDQIIDHLNGDIYGVADPRIEFITEEIDAGGYVGTRNGMGRDSDTAEAGDRSVLAVGSFYASGPTAPIEMVTYAELKFIEAEAALASDASRAYAAYEEGIRSHMEKLGVDPADIDAYWNEPVVSVGAGSLTIDEIMKEKYVATFLNPETWNDARRYDYGYDRFRAPANSALGSDMIRQVDYPDSEYQRNASNVPGKSLTDRIFWDVP